MKSAVSVITYNRVDILQEEMRGLVEHCSQYPIAVFDDNSNRDKTEAFLRQGRPGEIKRTDLLATELVGEGQKFFRAFLGDKNLGVAGNTNRAIKWFLEETDADHLCMCNDDLHVDGDFVDFYRQAHEDLGVGMFCFCDFTAPTYRWVDVKKRGYTVKLCPRMTGIMISVVRPLLNSIGYYDTMFGKFGEEHCDFTVRARLVGGIALDGVMQQQLDVHHFKVGEPPKTLIRHQEAETSVTGIERKRCDQESYQIMQRASQSYRHKQLHRPFSLWKPHFAGATRGAGVPVDQILSTYDLVADFWPKPL